MTVPFFSPLYRRIIAFWDPKVPARLRPLWEHPCGRVPGLHWIHLGQVRLTRTACHTVAPQSPVRYSLVIIPKNWSLFAVNFFVGLSGTFQLAKVLRYQMSLKEQEQKDSAAVVPA
ncbi:Mitochondrial pyruvate carrier 2 [Amphibalanus amphitrite]|uniref:Mitochondrial pyruvate carrier n=1 Tax=Amphibalanus amphitrite TaxID=1232801 RepID=A0A6A4WT99_AMPAM|nr:Mitochondrial pyruvate carrier 2 [Amphibalanus amphitrite]